MTRTTISRRSALAAAFAALFSIAPIAGPVALVSPVAAFGPPTLNVCGHIERVMAPTAKKTGWVTFTPIDSVSGERFATGHIVIEAQTASVHPSKAKWSAIVAGTDVCLNILAGADQPLGLTATPAVLPYAAKSDEKPARSDACGKIATFTPATETALGSIKFKPAYPSFSEPLRISEGVTMPGSIKKGASVCFVGVRPLDAFETPTSQVWLSAEALLKVTPTVFPTPTPSPTPRPSPTPTPSPTPEPTASPLTTPAGSTPSSAPTIAPTVSGVPSINPATPAPGSPSTATTEAGVPGIVVGAAVGLLAVLVLLVVVVRRRRR